MERNTEKTKKKYFVVSDIHGYYNELVEALKEKGFDEDNPEHELIVCGDVFDRGTQTIKVYDFLNSLERVHLISGNHELMLQNTLNRGFISRYDIVNGTAYTVDDFLCYEAEKAEKAEKGGESKRKALYWKKVGKRIDDFHKKFVNYFETENYIFVHAWIPIIESLDTIKYDENWRNAEQEKWDKAKWINPFVASSFGLNKTGKTIVFGHVRCDRRREITVSKDFSPYFEDKNGEKFIAIDASVYMSGKINCLVIEDREI